MHAKEPIVFEYGKAKLTIPVTAKTRIWVWVLTAALALGVNAYQLWKQQAITVKTYSKYSIFIPRAEMA
jgi:uncharacterized protein HemX